MKDKVIEEMYRICEKHYEETKDLSFEELAARINERGDAFQKFVEQTKQKTACRSVITSL